MQYRSSTPEFDRTIEGFNSGEHLANARRQADAEQPQMLRFVAFMQSVPEGKGAHAREWRAGDNRTPGVLSMAKDRGPR